MTSLSDEAKRLLDAPEFATVATIQPDGQPQLSVVWVARDHDDVLISTIRGRRKAVNLERDPRASVLIYPADSPYTYLEIRGSVTLEDDPTGSLIQALNGSTRAASATPATTAPTTSVSSCVCTPPTCTRTDSHPSRPVPENPHPRGLSRGPGARPQTLRAGARPPRVEAPLNSPGDPAPA